MEKEKETNCLIMRETGVPNPMSPMSPMSLLCDWVPFVLSPGSQKENPKILFYFSFLSLKCGWTLVVIWHGSLGSLKRKNTYHRKNLLYMYMYSHDYIAQLGTFQRKIKNWHLGYFVACVR